MCGWRNVFIDNNECERKRDGEKRRWEKECCRGTCSLKWQEKMLLLGNPHPLHLQLFLLHLVGEYLAFIPEIRDEGVKHIWIWLLSNSCCNTFDSNHRVHILGSFLQIRLNTTVVDQRESWRAGLLLQFTQSAPSWIKTRGRKARGAEIRLWIRFAIWQTQPDLHGVNLLGERRLHLAPQGKWDHCCASHKVQVTGWLQVCV